MDTCGLAALLIGLAPLNGSGKAGDGHHKGSEEAVRLSRMNNLLPISTRVLCRIPQKQTGFKLFSVKMVSVTGVRFACEF